MLRLVQADRPTLNKSNLRPETVKLRLLFYNGLGKCPANFGISSGTKEIPKDSF